MSVLNFLRPLSVQLAKPLAVASLLVGSSFASADWQLLNDQSQLSFVSVKKSAVVEVHRFKALEGSVSESGKAQVSIDLTSVDTNIGIRDQRMQEMLFETSLHPLATVSANIDGLVLKNLKTGQSSAMDVSFTVSLHGQTQTITTPVEVIALQGGLIRVSTLQPIVIKAADFKLIEGINRLKEIAGLPSITTAVPVIAQLTFKAS